MPASTGLAPGDPVVLTPAPPCGRCYWCVRGEAALCVDAIGIMTNTFADGTTGLSRGGATVYRGLNVGAFAEYVGDDRERRGEGRRATCRSTSRA